MEETNLEENTPEEKTEERRQITIQTMLESGVHFGHKTSIWNPKMAPYIHGHRNDVYIFNLERTLLLWQRARQVIVDTIARGGTILMVGPKKQCREVLEREAKRCGAYYISHKWVGGTLTNNATIRASIRRMQEIRAFLEKCEVEGSEVKITKKEKLMQRRELIKLEKRFGGIEDMRVLPDLIFLVDVVRYDQAVREAKNLHIPIVGLVDSNADPDKIDYIIPANDDANGALELFICNIADAILEGKEMHQASLVAIEKEPGDEKDLKPGDVEDIEVQKKVDGKVSKKRKKKQRNYPKKRKIADGINFYSEEYFEQNIK